MRLLSSIYPQVTAKTQPTSTVIKPGVFQTYDRLPRAPGPIKGDYDIWYSSWRYGGKHKRLYYYAKKGKGWNNARRVISGIYNYYSWHGFRYTARTDTDGCVSVSGGMMSNRKLGERELKDHQAGTDTRNEKRAAKYEKGIFAITRHHSDERPGELQHGLHSSNDGMHDWHVAHVPYIALADISHSAHTWSTGHHAVHEVHAGAEHDSLGHIAHLLAGRGHNPFESVHMYMLAHDAHNNGHSQQHAATRKFIASAQPPPK